VYLLVYLLLTLFSIGCGNSNYPFSGSGRDSAIWKDKSFSKYWYDGNAEINVFEVQQARYSGIHPGKTVLIFVTEDFLVNKQVKNERYAGEEYTSVLKTNLIRNFVTGIYDYSIMTSVFMPVDMHTYPHSLKVTGSAQDWCGQSFYQMNFANDQYLIRSFSYFEQQGDKEYHINSCLLEDEIFGLIRLGPEKLPIGEIEVIPGIAICRIKHTEIKPAKVLASQAKYDGNDFQGKNLRSYLLEFPAIDRSLEIVFEENFPYEIVGWKDTYPAMTGEIMTSKTSRIHKSKSKYWDQHDIEDRKLRSQLGLD
jgi:hypothetical protein